jgi:Leucine-rich repeat (LRR) protein
MLTMHDLVYDLARSVMDEELVVYNADKARSTVDRKYCRYASLTNCCKALNISTALPAKLRAMLFQDCRNLGIHDGSFSFAKCLHVLDLTESSVSKFPTSVGQLKQLRFLIAPRMKNLSFPNSFTGLSKLQYLSIRGSSMISSMPESIGNLNNLMYLDLSGCSEIEKLPKSLRNLKNMVHLDLSACSGLKVISKVLCDLTKLQYLNLSSCSNLGRLPQDLGNLTELQYLYLCGCLKISVLPESLGKLINLVHLDLSLCSFVMPEELGGLTKLKYLNLSGGLNNERQAKKNIDYVSILTNLEHLDLSWNFFPSLPESIGNLKRLHTLDLSGCRNLSSLPNSIGSIHSLELLVVNDCSKSLKDYIRKSGLRCNPLSHLVVRPNDGDSGSNLHQLEGINPSELQISYLENVRIPGEAIGIELCNKENLSKLTLHWTMEADPVLNKDVLGALVPPNGLKHLELNGYSSISFPNWFMDITHYLPILVSVKLKNLLSCSSLPPNLKELYLERLSSIAKIGGDFCGRKRAFLQLSRFTLLKMERLEEWTTTYCSEDGTEEFMCPVLDELVISNCPRLRLKPCPPIFRRWTISHSDEVLNSGDEEGNFSHFNSSTPRTRLVVWSKSYYCGSWGLLGHLPTLQELEIKRPSHMTSLPESMRQLASLCFLELYKCNDISVLPE